MKNLLAHALVPLKFETPVLECRMRGTQLCTTKDAAKHSCQHRFFHSGAVQLCKL